MKKFLFIVIAAILFLFTFPPIALSNTVSVFFDSVKSRGIDVSGFDLHFFGPAVNASHGWPTTNDFDYNWGPGQPAADWTLYLIETLDNKVRGITALDDFINQHRSLDDGLVLTLASLNTIFGINIQDSRNIFFDYGGSVGNEIQGIKLSESWVDDNQSITVSAIPEPSTVILLGCGLIGLVADALKISHGPTQTHTKYRPLARRLRRLYRKKLRS